MTDYAAVRPHIAFGYHGCDQDIGEQVLRGAEMIASKNGYDWLGTGYYFWEADPARAMLWAIEARERHKRDGRASNIVRRPYVFGAVIHLGKCLDLTTLQGAALVKKGFLGLRAKLKAAQLPMPRNKGGREMKGRYLDDQVINHVCADYLEKKLEAFDTVRAVFLEGDRLYGGGGFRELTHTQLSVRKKEAILGFFRIEQPKILGHDC